MCFGTVSLQGSTDQTLERVSVTHVFSSLGLRIHKITVNQNEKYLAQISAVLWLFKRGCESLDRMTLTASSQRFM